MTATLAARTGTFHRLGVRSLVPASADGSAIAVELDVPPQLRPSYAFTAGQHVTLRFAGASGQLRRTYSICSTPAELATGGVLRLGVRRIPGGAFAAFSAELAAGAELDVLTPSGGFGTGATEVTGAERAYGAEPGRRWRYAALAAGSGVTPLLSIVADTLAAEPLSTFALVYANRTVASTMFVDELAEVKDRFLHRFELFHLISREPRREGLRTGRLDPATLRGLLPAVLEPAAIQEWLLCGSQQLCRAAITVLDELSPGAAVRTELFYAEQPGGDRTAADPAGPAVPATGDAPAAGGWLTTIANGRSVRTPLLPGRSVLDSALAGEPDLPYSCTTGVCGTCRARVVAGEVDAGSPWALTPQEIAAGQILTCRARPRSDALTVDFDQP